MKHVKTKLRDYIKEGVSTYRREIPRDFFNEAKLLKCMGRLSLLIAENNTPNNIEITISGNGEPFKIEQDISGDIFVSNYICSIKDVEVTFATILNSKSTYPFICKVGYDEISVFDESGYYDKEFIEFCESL